ncbi:major capsid protein [Veillonella magna]|uniref:Coat protein n=1 Tax=Veillonella magna TaxID=464322 RepID=A0ABS2GG21_9FIRM|nr:major capsid protein [Veillonella magna]MBM6824797.1 coat protein [Veillonella magna]MBM6913124.1 coat protein [Veillonella magna]
MGETTIRDVIVPEFFDKYSIKRTMELSALYNSGIVVNSQKFDELASEAAPTHNMPFFEDLSGRAQNMIEGQEVAANKITSNKDVSTTIRRFTMHAATNLSAALAGTDPMAAIGDLVAGYWARQMQLELISILKGVFASTSMKDHVLDISGMTGKAANIGAESFIDALQLLGDAQGQLTGVVMHSATKSYLKKRNLIDTQRDSTDVEFDTYQGRRVIVDDGCPVDGDVYTTYLFGNGAIALGNGSPVGHKPSEIARDPKTGAGIDYLITRRVFILHPRGIAWQNAKRANVESVSPEELEDKTNWKRVYEPKDIRMVAFKHKINQADATL